MKRFFIKTGLFLIGFALAAATAAFADDIYPRLNFDGYKKYEYKKVDVSPLSNYFNGLSQLGGYYPTYSGGPWQERLLLKIEGQLSKQLSVTYDLEEQPENPSRYDVKVRYDNHELIFGDINVAISGNEFASINKYLNGVIYRTKGDNYDFILVPSAKSKSQNQPLASFYGTNIRGPYSLGHTNIIEGSEKIYFNNVLLSRKKDYEIDYFGGKVTFTEIVNSGDEIKYTYEYTNIIDLFFPTLSRREFVGTQGRFTFDPSRIGYREPLPLPVYLPAQDEFPSVLPPNLSLDEESSLEGAYRGKQEKRLLLEEERAGEYQLSRTPIVSLSDQVEFGGQVLNKELDYKLNYETGVLQLFTSDRPSPDRKLKVQYEYKVTSSEVERPQGEGGRGPYTLKYKPVIRNSEKVSVNGVPLLRDIDYLIDYEKAAILFNIEIGAAADIKVAYSYALKRVAAVSKTEEPPTPLTVGVTYLRESAKSGATSVTTTVSEIFTGQTIINNSNAIYLSQRPLVPTTEGTLVVKRNGVTLNWGTDYVIPTSEVDSATGYYHTIPGTKLPTFINRRDDPSDGYDTSTIKYLGATLNATDEISVYYTYRKAVMGRYPGRADGRSEKEPYYLSNNFRNIVPGSETVQVWTEGSSIVTIYTRNSSFDANMGDTGYFFNYYEDRPAIYFNKPLDNTKHFAITFQYIPAAAAVGQDIAQEVIGCDLKYTNRDFKVDGDLAMSNADNVVISVSTKEDFSGSGAKTYTLHAPAAIIENSEQLYINNKIQNKDLDYYINYSAPGQIVFYYVTPATADSISIIYEYQSTSGVGGGTATKRGTAFRVAAEKSFFEVLNVGANYRQLDPDFRPVGSTPTGVGSKYLNGRVGYSPLSNFSLAYDVLNTDDQIGTYRGKYLHRYDHKINTTFVPYGQWKVNLNYRRNTTEDDLLPGNTLHTSDSILEEWNGALLPPSYQQGEVLFTNREDFRTSTARTDAIDLVDPRTNRTDYIRTNNVLNVTKRFSADLDLQISEPRTLQLTSEGGASREVETAHTQAKDLSWGMLFDLTYHPVQKLVLRTRFINHDGVDFKNAALTNATKNESYHLDFIPVAVLVTALDHSRDETLTVVVGGRNPKNERTSSNVTYTPWPSTRIAWDYGQSESIIENGNVSGGHSNTWNLNYLPFATNFWRLALDFKLLNRRAFSPQGTAEVNTYTDSFNQQYGITFTPFSNFSLAPGFNQEDYFNRNDAPTSAVYTKTQNQTVFCKLAYTPITQLNFISDYSLKVTKDLVGGINRNKSLWTNRLNYALASWGTLGYEWVQENNGGEVQAGSLIDLDYLKNTHSLSFKVNIPFENPILTSTVVDISYKMVEFINRKNSADDLRASLLCFEGSLNF